MYDVYSAWTGIHMEYHSNNTAKWTTKIEQFVGQNISNSSTHKKIA